MEHLMLFNPTTLQIHYRKHFSDTSGSSGDQQLNADRMLCNFLSIVLTAMQHAVNDEQSTAADSISMEYGNTNVYAVRTSTAGTPSQQLVCVMQLKPEVAQVESVKESVGLDVCRYILSKVVQPTPAVKQQSTSQQTIKQQMKQLLKSGALQQGVTNIVGQHLLSVMNDCLFERSSPNSVHDLFCIHDTVQYDRQLQQMQTHPLLSHRHKQLESIDFINTEVDDTDHSMAGVMPASDHSITPGQPTARQSRRLQRKSPWHMFACCSEQQQSLQACQGQLRKEQVQANSQNTRVPITAIIHSEEHSGANTQSILTAVQRTISANLHQLFDGISGADVVHCVMHDICLEQWILVFHHLHTCAAVTIDATTADQLRGDSKLPGRVGPEMRALSACFEWQASLAQL